MQRAVHHRAPLRWRRGRPMVARHQPRGPWWRGNLDPGGNRMAKTFRLNDDELKVLLVAVRHQPRGPWWRGNLDPGGNRMANTFGFNDDELKLLLVAVRHQPRGPWWRGN